MALRNLSEEIFRTILSKNVTPSATTRTPDRLYGREHELIRITRAFNSPGRQVFLYGDRGVGKTSLALTAANLASKSYSSPVYVVCAEGDTFANVMKAIGKSVLSVTERVEVGGLTSSLGVLIAALTGGHDARRLKLPVEDPQSLNDSLDIVRYVLAARPGRIIIIIDEMERIKSPLEKEKFSEFIKNIPETDDRVRFIFCGVAATIKDLVGAHPSVGRILEPIHLDRLAPAVLEDLVTRVADKLELRLDQEVLTRIVQLSDGFPHYVHLVAEAMFWSVFDDPQVVRTVCPAHLQAGVKGALERAEAMLRADCDKATAGRHAEEYETVLWALADTSAERREVKEIYKTSYVPIMATNPYRRQLSLETFHRRLLALRDESRGSIVTGHGSGWFAFRENIVRGYLRLRAQNKGVRLGRLPGAGLGPPSAE